MSARSSRFFDRGHRFGQIRRAMAQSPCEAQERGKEDRDADRLVELVELEQPRWFELEMRHRKAHCDERGDSQRHHPMKDDGDRRVAAGGIVPLHGSIADERTSLRS